LLFAERPFRFSRINTLQFGQIFALGLHGAIDHNHPTMWGTGMMRIGADVAAAIGLSGLAIYAWLRIRRRSWSVSSRDETMRRHINQHYS
jgi:hypothetical protein